MNKLFKPSVEVPMELYHNRIDHRVWGVFDIDFEGRIKPHRRMLLGAAPIDLSPLPSELSQWMKQLVDIEYQNAVHSVLTEAMFRLPAEVGITIAGSAEPIYAEDALIGYQITVADCIAANITKSTTDQSVIGQTPSLVALIELKTGSILQARYIGRWPLEEQTIQPEVVGLFDMSAGLSEEPNIDEVVKQTRPIYEAHVCLKDIDNHDLLYQVSCRLVSFHGQATLFMALAELTYLKSGADEDDHGLMQSSALEISPNLGIRKMNRRSSGLYYRPSWTNLDVKERACVERILSDPNALCALANRVIDLGARRDEKPAVEVVEFDLFSVLDACRSSVFHNFKKRRELEFQTIVAPDMPRYLIGSPELLTQALTQALHQVVSDAGSNGIILTVQSVGDLYEICITSAPKGSPIFRDVFQAHQETKKPIALKLNQALLNMRHLVEIAGGELWVESNTLYGSSIILSMPRCSSETRFAMPASQMNRGSVLIASDSIPTIEMVTSLCARTNLDAKCVSLASLNVTDSEEFCCVVVDLPNDRLRLRKTLAELRRQDLASCNHLVLLCEKDGLVDLKELASGLRPLVLQKPTQLGELESVLRSSQVRSQPKATDLTLDEQVSNNARHLVNVTEHNEATVIEALEAYDQACANFISELPKAVEIQDWAAAFGLFNEFSDSCISAGAHRIDSLTKVLANHCALRIALPMEEFIGALKTEKDLFYSQVSQELQRKAA